MKVEPPGVFWHAVHTPMSATGCIILVEGYIYRPHPPKTIADTSFSLRRSVDAVQNLARGYGDAGHILTKETFVRLRRNSYANNTHGNDFQNQGN